MEIRREQGNERNFNLFTSCKLVQIKQITSRKAKQQVGSNKKKDITANTYIKYETSYIENMLGVK